MARHYSIKDFFRQMQVFPLLCPLCSGQMRLIAFITEGVQ